MTQKVIPEAKLLFVAVTVVISHKVLLMIDVVAAQKYSFLVYIIIFTTKQVLNIF